MLHDFLTANRDDLIDRCRAKVSQRLLPKATDAELEYGIPLFLDQLIRTLQSEQTTEIMEGRRISGPSGGVPVMSEIGATAKQHGRELLEHGFTVDQVVHNYGDLCQAITDAAFEGNAPIDVDEFRTLNRCLDNAIADSVTEFSYQSDLLLAEKGVQALNERLGTLAHELRNFIHTATLAVTAIKAGNVGLNGATGAVLDRSLIGLRNLIDRSLADVRVTAGLPARSEIFSLADFISEAKLSAALEAQSRECSLTVSHVEQELAVDGDRDMLFSAVGNLLQNAFKFTEHHSDVNLDAYGVGDRIRIDISDRCGGLPSGLADKMFHPFTQGGKDKSGLGLGLSICRRSVEANRGTLSVRNVAGLGCVFTIDLPRHAMPQVN